MSRTNEINVLAGCKIHVGKERLCAVGTLTSPKTVFHFPLDSTNRELKHLEYFIPE